MASLGSIEEEIAKQSARYNELRLQPNGDPVALEEVRQKLGELKKTLGQAKAAAGGGKKKEERDRLLLKTAKVRMSLSCLTWRIQFMYSGIGFLYRELETLDPQRCTAVNISNALSRTVSRYMVARALIPPFLSERIS
jgi:hypothetical protein